MPNKRGRPKRRPEGYKPTRVELTLESEEQKEQLKKLGGSAWVRGKLQEEKEKRDV